MDDPNAPRSKESLAQAKHEINPNNTNPSILNQEFLGKIQSNHLSSTTTTDNRPTILFEDIKHQKLNSTRDIKLTTSSNAQIYNHTKGYTKSLSKDLDSCDTNNNTIVLNPSLSVDYSDLVKIPIKRNSNDLKKLPLEVNNNNNNTTNVINTNYTVNLRASNNSIETFMEDGSHSSFFSHVNFLKKEEDPATQNSIKKPANHHEVVHKPHIGNMLVGLDSDDIENSPRNSKKSMNNRSSNSIDDDLDDYKEYLEVKNDRAKLKNSVADNNNNNNTKAVIKSRLDRMSSLKIFSPGAGSTRMRETKGNKIFFPSLHKKSYSKHHAHCSSIKDDSILHEIIPLNGNTEKKKHSLVTIISKPFKSFFN